METELFDIKGMKFGPPEGGIFELKEPLGTWHEKARYEFALAQLVVTRRTSPTSANSSWERQSRLQSAQSSYYTVTRRKNARFICTQGPTSQTRLATKSLSGFAMVGQLRKRKWNLTPAHAVRTIQCCTSFCRENRPMI